MAKKPETDETPPPASSGPRWLRSPFVLGIGLSMLATGVVVFLVRWDRTAVEPAIQQARSLALLDAHGDGTSRRKARAIARGLLESDHRDPGFGGALEFVIGVTTFRDAEEAGQLAAEDQYAEVVDWLREAERRSLPASRRPEWSYALGVSLARIGAADEAAPHLLDALDAADPNDLERLDRLARAAVSTQLPPLLERVAALADATPFPPGTNVERIDAIRVQSARALSLLGRADEADELLARVPEELREGRSTLVFRAQGLMAVGDNGEAIKLLERVTANSFDDPEKREAAFLLGRAAEAIDDVDNAILHYEHVASNHPDTSEAVAAEIRLAELLRRAGRREESLDGYRRAVGRLASADEFRNRWISLEEFRATSIAAWAGFVEEGAYADAIELASLLGPLLPESGAVELQARAEKRWAEDLQQRYFAARETERRELRPKLIRRWRETGLAYTKLARALRTTTEYGDLLREAAEQCSMGHEFERALELYDDFLVSKPGAETPEALLARGRVLFDLGRIEDAGLQFEDVANRYPTSATAYLARLEVGRCLLAADRFDEATEVWQTILDSPELDPQAFVWREALFELGRLARRRAGIAANAARLPDVADDERRAALARQNARLGDTITLLDEYLRRYETGEHVDEARFLVATAHHDLAERVQEEMELAETQNVREERRRRREQLLQRSIREYRILRESLQPRADDDRLDVVHAEFLQRSHVDLARALFDLGRYEQALAAYSEASNRFSDDARILVCYVQMANAHQRLGHTVEARSVLQQARLILQRLPDQVFQSDSTSMSRADWERWIEWAADWSADDGTARTQL